MRNTLKWIRDRFNNPDIIITENGYSDNSGNLDDMMRVYYYKHNINNVLKGTFTYNFFKSWVIFLKLSLILVQPLKPMEWK